MRACRRKQASAERTCSLQDDTRRVRTGGARATRPRRAPTRSGHFGSAAAHVPPARLWLSEPKDCAQSSRPHTTHGKGSPELCNSPTLFYPPPPPRLLLSHIPHFRMPDVFVKSFTHLKNRPHADRALRILQRIASLVKPIMRKHEWVLPVLSEFFPENPSLLGEYPSLTSPCATCP